MKSLHLPPKRSIWVLRSQRFEHGRPKKAANLDQLYTDSLAEPSLLARLSEVARIVQLSERTIWALVANGRFPKPMRFGRVQLCLRREAVAAVAARLDDRG